MQAFANGHILLQNRILIHNFKKKLAFFKSGTQIAILLNGINKKAGIPKIEEDVNTLNTFLNLKKLRIYSGIVLAGLIVCMVYLFLCFLWTYSNMGLTPIIGNSDLIGNIIKKITEILVWTITLFN